MRGFAAALVSVVESAVAFVGGRPLRVYVFVGLLLGVAILVALVEFPNRRRA